MIYLPVKASNRQQRLSQTRLNNSVTNLGLAKLFRENFKPIYNAEYEAFDDYLR